jgi:hypothetical protein
VLLAHAPAGQQTVETFSQLGALGLNKRDYPRTFTPSQGSMKSVGLDVAGASAAYGTAELYAQDASILGEAPSPSPAHEH